MVRRWLIWIVAVGLVFGSGCASLIESKRPPLVVAYSPWPGFLPIAIAEAKGYFAEQGVAVKTLFSTAAEVTTTQMADFAAEKLDVVALSLGSIVRVASRNPDVRILVVCNQSDGADAVVARPEIKSVADLRGKRVGTNLGGFGELFVATMLEKNALTTDDVVLVNVEGENVPKRFQAKDIQAGSTWEPYVTESLGYGAKILFTSREAPGLILDVIAFLGRVVRDRPEDVKAFLRAWFQAVDYWLANPDEGSALIAQTLKVDPATVSLQGLELLTLADNLKAFQPSKTSASVLHTSDLYNDFFIRTGSISQPVDTKQLLDDGFLQALKAK